MAIRRNLSLNPDQRVKLVRLRDTGEKPHMRERAAALIKISDGQSAYEVARSGLLKPRDVDSIYAWLDRYEEEGIDGLNIRPGRGRKPAFSPSDPVGRSRAIRDHARGRA
jgi:Winged helix-turn helix